MLNNQSKYLNNEKGRKTNFGCFFVKSVATKGDCIKAWNRLEKKQNHRAVREINERITHNESTADDD